MSTAETDRCGVCGAALMRGDAEACRVTEREAIEHGAPAGSLVCAACWHAMLWPPPDGAAERGCD